MKPGKTGLWQAEPRAENDFNSRATAVRYEHTVIRPPSRWPNLGLAELWRLRQICLVLAKRNLMIRYRQTLIGGAWSLIQPLLLMSVFTVFFGALGRLPSNGLPYPLFYLMGLVPWQMVAKILNQGATSVVSNAALVTRIYVPRAYFPTAVAISSLLDLLLAAIPLGFLMLLFGVFPHPSAIVALPLLIGIAWTAGLGVAYWLSALNVKYRDVTQLLPFLTTLWMFCSPIIYPATLVPEPYRLLYYANPMALVVSGSRWALGGGQLPELPLWIVSTVAAGLLLVSGYVFFRYRERDFADVI